MQKQIISFIDDLKSNEKLASFDQASTKQAVVLRLLSFLGWDIFNVEEVYPDFSTNSSNVSYALRINNSSKVFIEVKRVHKKLDSYQSDLVDLAARDGVDLAILTNGIIWWFYLASESGNWKEKWFHSIDLLKQNPEIIVPELDDLLTKNKVTKGQSMKTAKTLFQKKKQTLASDFLPEAWNQILTQPNKIFVELLCEQTEKLCSYKLDAKTVKQFIKKHQDKWLLKNKGSSVPALPAAAMKSEILNMHRELPKSPSKSLSSTNTSLSGTDTSYSGGDTILLSDDPPSPSTGVIRLADSYKDKSIESFSFNGNTYKIQTWVEMLTTLSDYFALTNKKDFEKVLWISNDQKAHFSRYGDQLRMPEKVKRTDIFVETKLNPEEVVRTSCQLLAEFGYSQDDLDIEAT